MRIRGLPVVLCPALLSVLLGAAPPAPASEDTSAAHATRSSGLGSSAGEHALLVDAKAAPGRSGAHRLRQPRAPEALLPSVVPAATTFAWRLLRLPVAAVPASTLLLPVPGRGPPGR